MKKEEIIKKLSKIVGSEWVRTDDLIRYHFCTDVLTHFGQGAIYPSNQPLVIVFPGSTKDVQQVIKLAHQNKIALYAIGGGTVLLIGSIPGKANFGITFDFHRMQGVNIDEDRLVVRCQPGCTGLQVSQLIRDKNIGYRP